MPSVKSWFEELMAQSRSRDRRKGQRHEAPPVVAYYWDGGTPASHPVRDISSAGLYVVTPQCWYVGTVVTMTLQRTGEDPGPECSISVQARVVRSGADGVGLAFVLQSPQDVRHRQSPSANGADRKALSSFLRSLLAGRVTGSGGEQLRLSQTHESRERKP